MEYSNLELLAKALKIRQLKDQNLKKESDEYGNISWRNPKLGNITSLHLFNKWYGDEVNFGVDKNTCTLLFPVNRSDCKFDDKTTIEQLKKIILNDRNWEPHVQHVDKDIIIQMSSGKIQSCEDYYQYLKDIGKIK